MRVYQAIHCYPKHLELFERTHRLDQRRDLTFTELHRLLIDDGYAAAYMLEPAIHYRTDEVFFTVWDYPRLQHLWADEHGVASRDLSEIKRAQIEWYQPDVFYDFSAWMDRDFLERMPIDPRILTIAWNGLIYPQTKKFQLHDARLTLHRPYVKQWNDAGLPAGELQPAIAPPSSQHFDSTRPIDFLFYGQWGGEFFGNRSRLAAQLIEQARKQSLNACVALTYRIRRWPKIPYRVLWRLGIPFDPPRMVRRWAHPPLYGQELAAAIAQSKYVINAFTNNNTHFKSNMRLTETLSGGATLVSESGIYPDGFEPGRNFIAYDNPDHLFSMLRDLADRYSEIKAQLAPGVAELNTMYSKERQWTRFQQLAHQFAGLCGKSLSAGSEPLLDNPARNSQRIV